MVHDDKLVEEILVRGSYISSDDLKTAKEFIKNTGGTLLSALYAKKILNKDLFGQAMAEYFKVPYSDLNSFPPNKEQVLLIPESIATKYHVVVFIEKDDIVVVSTDNPVQKDLLKDLRILFGDKKKINITYSLEEDILNIFTHYQKSLDDRLKKIIEEQNEIATSILDELFKEAFSGNASDVHFEPKNKNVLVRFRIDGVLQNIANIPIEYYENILNRIKVLSKLRIDEHSSSQDGSIRYVEGDNNFDLRVSIIPTLSGEKIVLRVLASYVRGYSLSDIGMSKEDQELIIESAKKPFGMIINTGPTGSGKTTTLYSILKLIDDPGLNITTIEDPVEYRVMGINQIQVNAQTNLTFAKGLRSVVRQDPDIILVGEIRDQETADIATNAALTGHLLLSTFHANDAATAVPRLLDMGVEPFLLASTLELIIAQRLLRKICENCKYSYTVTSSELKKEYKDAGKYLKGSKITLYKGKGCNVCKNTGYSGRTAIFEIIKVVPEIKDLILTHPSSREIWNLAEKYGSQRLFDNGIVKVQNGVSTLEELMRVAPPPEYEEKKKTKK